MQPAGARFAPPTVRLRRRGMEDSGMFKDGDGQ